MRLKPVQKGRAVSLKRRARGEFHAALTDYASYYRETTDQTIDAWSLVGRTPEPFAETDREFLAWRRPTRNERGAGPTTSK
jgi:hypothetical protein